RYLSGWLYCRIAPDVRALLDLAQAVPLVIDVLGHLPVGIDHDDPIADLVVAKLGDELGVSGSRWSRSLRESDAILVVVGVFPGVLAEDPARRKAVGVDHLDAAPDRVV